MSEGNLNLPSSSPSTAPSKSVSKLGEGLDRISESIASDLEKLEVVSESAKENADRNDENFSGGNQGDNSSQAGSAQAMLRRQQLINSKPTKSRMVADIRRTISLELKSLEIKEAKAKRKGLEAARELNEAVSQIRTLRRILANIAHATYDQLKKLWLRIVHGIV